MLISTPSVLVRMVFIAPICLYQQFFSPVFGPRRRYLPSCLAYTL